MSTIQVDLESGCVSTILGSGVQGNDKEGGRKGEEQEISSPWDLAIGDSVGECCVSVWERPE